MTSPLQEGERWSVTPVPPVQISDEAGKEIELSYTELVVKWMHFELEQEPTVHPAIPAVEQAPMETDAESSTTAGLTTLTATQARVSEGRTLTTPASGGRAPTAAASEGRTLIAELLSEGRTLAGQLGVPKRRRRWTQVQEVQPKVCKEWSDASELAKMEERES